MSIIDTVGYKKKDKKLLLTISKEDFMDRMIIHDEQERVKCIKYLELKGVAYHVVLANYIGLNRNGMIEHRKISYLYQYDKRIRNILYRFLSAFEEGIRAFISNAYSNNLERFKKVSNRIVRLVEQGSSLPKELEELTFKELLDISKKLDKQMLIELYGNIDHLSNNLDAIRELRNTVSHHKMLFVYDDFESCFIDGIEEDNLIANLKNVYQLLNPYYKKFYKEAINNSCIDKKDSLFNSSLPKKAIIAFYE